MPYYIDCLTIEIDLTNHFWILCSACMSSLIIRFLDPLILFIVQFCSSSILFHIQIIRPGPSLIQSYITRKNTISPTPNISEVVIANIFGPVNLCYISSTISN